MSDKAASYRTIHHSLVKCYYKYDTTANLIQALSARTTANIKWSKQKDPKFKS